MLRFCFDLNNSVAKMIFSLQIIITDMLFLFPIFLIGNSKNANYKKDNEKNTFST